MDLSKISINARARNPWEALDLGILLARAWWWPLFFIWLVPASLVFVVSSFVFSDLIWLPYLLVWWLKPLFDRGPLYIASRRLFGESVGFWDTFRALPSIYRTELFVWLTVRRFSLTRSFDMPLTVLEQLRGKVRSSRQGVLHRKYGGVANWLSVICIHVEMFLLFGIMSFLVIMIPDHISIDYFQLALDQQDMAMWMYNVMAFLCMAIVGPFYSVSGFCLYISRRIDLEAWDIEIRFRHLADKHQQELAARQGKVKRTTSAVSALLIALCVTLTFDVTPVRAQDNENLDANQSTEFVAPESVESTRAINAKTSIIEILEGEKFHEVETVRGWRIKDLEKHEAGEKDEIPEWLINFIMWLVKLMASMTFDGGSSFDFAFLFEVFIWIVVIAVVVLVIYRYREAIQHIVFNKTKVELEPEIPESLFGLDVRKESLPDDVATAVQQLWSKGMHRDSVSLLYRSLLGALIHRYNITFSASNTENECVSIVKGEGKPEISDFTENVTDLWQRLAYGHQLPSDTEIQELCGRWRVVFPDA